jgi:23S rRNA-/tRNA-specific pseudouridylate synthase
MPPPREKRWTVRTGDGASLGDVLAKLGADRTAVAEGRVFVGRHRASRYDQPVRPGDVVRVTSAERKGAPVTILFDEGGLVATIKPAGIPTVPDHAGAAHSFVALVAAAIGAGPKDLRVTSRLDRDVSGVIVFARDERTEARLREARAEGRYQRRYVAIATGQLGERGTWDAPIGRVAGSPRLRAAFGADAKPAETRWARVRVAPPSFLLLAVDPITGRTHQIRVHASHAGAPLVGDADYGGLTRITRPDGSVLAPRRIALHAARVIVPGARGGHGHGHAIEASAPIPEELLSLWSALGGATDDWAEALAAP